MTVHSINAHTAINQMSGTLVKYWLFHVSQTLLCKLLAMTLELVVLVVLVFAMSIYRDAHNRYTSTDSPLKVIYVVNAYLFYERLH